MPSFELGTDLSKCVSQASKNLEGVEIDSIYKYLSESNLSYDEINTENNISLSIYNAKFFYL